MFPISACHRGQEAAQKLASLTISQAHLSLTAQWNETERTRKDGGHLGIRSAHVPTKCIFYFLIFFVVRVLILYFGHFLELLGQEKASQNGTEKEEK